MLTTAATTLSAEAETHFIPTSARLSLVFLLNPDTLAEVVIKRYLLGNEMKRHTLSTALCMTLLAVSCARPPDYHVRRALDGVLAPEASRSKTIDVLSALEHNADIVPILNALGTNNFTTFFLSLQQDSPLIITDAFECMIPKIDIQGFGQYLGTHATAVAVADINDLTHTSYPDGTGEGTFSVDMEWGFRATFLFRTHAVGRNVRVTKLSVKRKTSTDVDDGLVIAQKE